LLCKTFLWQWKKTKQKEKSRERKNISIGTTRWPRFSLSVHHQTRKSCVAERKSTAARCSLRQRRQRTAEEWPRHAVLAKSYTDGHTSNTRFIAHKPIVMWFNELLGFVDASTNIIALSQRASSSDNASVSTTAPNKHVPQWAAVHSATRLVTASASISRVTIGADQSARQIRSNPSASVQHRISLERRFPDRQQSLSFRTLGYTTFDAQHNI
jgi:hypothetical protein